MFLYQIFFGVGLATGLFSAFALWRIPESGAFRRLKRFSFREQLSWLLETKGRRWFLAMMVAIPVTQGVTRLFLILFVKQGYGLSDGETVLFVLIGMVGGLGASYAYGFFMDKLGSRPLLFLIGLLDALGIGLVVVLPEQLSYVWLATIFVFNGMAHVAFQASTQHYFISITNAENQLSQGILTQTIGGLSGGGAMLIAGVLLSKIQSLPVLQDSSLLPFQWFFAGMFVLALFRQWIFFKLPLLRSQGIRDSLNVLFSPWDWRAIHAVKRAVGQASEDEETRALDTILRSGEKGPYQDDLAGFLQSPSWMVRERAMEALGHVRPTTELVDLLLKDLKENQFTTAHWSAKWLGRWGSKRAVPLLREAIEGPDILLRAKAIHALVEMGDREALPLIRHRFGLSPNPAVIIECARAISLWGGTEGFGEVLTKLAEPMPPQARDELYLSLARIAGCYDRYYHDLVLFRRDRDSFQVETKENLKNQPGSPFAQMFFDRKLSPAKLATWITDHQAQFEPWFVEASLAFLTITTDEIEEPAGLLFLVLLLANQGNHLNQT